MITYKRAFLALISILFVSGSVVAMAGGANAKARSSSIQDQGQNVTQIAGSKFLAAEPYPLSQMNDSAERANLRERLVRLNDPHKVGYLYGLSSTGQVMAFWTIKGKASSMGSQLTNSQATEHHSGGDGGNLTFDSMGDDGTYGPEECQTQGVFAFTADTNALVEWCGPWFYSDAPLKLTTAPIILIDPAAKPTSDAGLNNK